MSTIFHPSHDVASGLWRGITQRSLSLRASLVMLCWLLLAVPANAAMSIFQATLQVYLDGAVRQPGLYTLPRGARLAEAIAAAGGPKPGAKLDGLNLAQRLEDGERFRVPVAVAPVTGSHGASKSQPARHAAKPRASRSARKTAAPRRASRAQKVELGKPINVNRADLEILDRLPGVGPAMAKRIVETRKRLGGFRTLEDLREVPGIGAKRLEKLRPYVLLKSTK